jgi:hypothetical protein
MLLSVAHVFPTISSDAQLTHSCCAARIISFHRTAEGEARLRRLDASRLWAPSTPKGKFLCGPRRRQAKLGPAALRALCAALRLARRLGLLLRCRLGGGGGRRLLAAGGRDAAQLLPRHVGGAVRLDALGALYVVSRAAGSTVM